MAEETNFKTKPFKQNEIGFVRNGLIFHKVRILCWKKSTKCWRKNLWEKLLTWQKKCPYVNLGRLLPRVKSLSRQRVTPANMLFRQNVIRQDVTRQYVTRPKVTSQNVAKPRIVVHSFIKTMDIYVVTQGHFKWRIHRYQWGIGQSEQPITEVTQLTCRRTQTIIIGEFFSLNLYEILRIF